MIQQIPQITVNGQNSIFGGFIYNAKISIKYGEDKSTVVISVISESGNYLISPIDLQNTFCHPFTIQLGPQITFVGYLLSYHKNISPAGNTLDLTYTDTSNVLDVVQVGLLNKFGIVSSPTLLICGFELDPCNPNNYASPIPNFFDPCSPCNNDQAAADIKNYIDCEEKAKYEIHDVKYNFSDLLGKIQVYCKIPMVGAFDPNPQYLQQYTGSLREVLVQWCQDFGFFFYWDSGTLNFIDLRNTIQVNTNIENFCPNVLSYTEEYSMENSIQTATITNFARPGDPAKLYDCQEAKYIECTALPQQSNSPGQTGAGAQPVTPLTITPNIDRVGAGLSYYSDELRNLYHFYITYQMYDTNNFTIGKYLPKLGLTIRSTPITLHDNQPNTDYNSIDQVPAPDQLKSIPDNASSISPFDSNVTGLIQGGLTKDQQQNIQDIINNQDFYNCVQSVDFENQWKIVTNPDSFFFFVAEHNETIHNKFLQEEKEYSSILNKYAVLTPDPNDSWYEDYDFQLDNLCGINYFVNTGNVSYVFLGDSMGSLKFYNTSANTISDGYGTPMSELPFAKFLAIIHDNNNESATNQLTNLGGFLPFKLIVAERGRNTFVPESVTTNPNGNNGLIGSVAPGENPTEVSNPIQDYNILSQLGQLLPYKCANKNNLRGDFTPRILEAADISDANTREDIFIYLGCFSTPDDYLLTQINGYNNNATFGTLFDGKPLNKEQDPTLQFEQIVYQYPDLQCSIVGNHSFGSRFALHANVITFKTPVGQFQYTEPTDALFGTVIEKHKKDRRIVEKIESIYTSNLPNTIPCNANKVKTNYRNISDDSLRVLTFNNNICQYSASQIAEIHELFTNNLALNYTQPTISKTFKIAGIELNNYNPTIGNGLLNLEISLDDKGGIYSVYEFGTRLMIIPAERAVNYNNVNLLSPHGSYTNTVNYYPTLGQPNL